MGVDVAITWDTALGRGDWSFAYGDLALGPALEQAVIVSLFSDRVAPQQPSAADASVGIGPPGQTGADRRGWWPDTYATVPIGSRLWQLARAIKANAALSLQEVEDVCDEALQWLLDDGVVASVAVVATWATPTAVKIAVTIAEPSGASPQVFNYQWAWSGL